MIRGCFRILVIVVSSSLTGMSAAAQVRPHPGLGDPHIQSITYQSNQVVAIEAALGYQVTIELAPDEKIENAAVGDSSAWQVSDNQAGNRLFVKPLQAGAPTNLTVITNVRTYAFTLDGLETPSSLTPYTVQFHYGETPTAALPFVIPNKDQAVYRLSGDRALRPERLGDDGVHTYIKWAHDAALPATYFIDDEGREVLANGRMRDGVYIVDGVARRLVFRIDKKVAKATRAAPRVVNR